MKTVLFVINQLYKGGAEQALVRLVRALPANRFAVSVVVYAQRENAKAISLVNQLPSSAKVFVGAGGVETDGLIEFVSSTVYDLAVSDGEWHSPEFVMTEVRAKRRAIMIHADVTSPSIRTSQDLFDYNRETDIWICVSNVQCRRMRECAPFLTGAILPVHNLIDVSCLEEASQVPVRLPPCCRPSRRIIMMVGNLRPAKNYIRAVEAAAALRDLGCDAVWLVCGNLADCDYVSEVRRAIERNRLQERFILLGAQENPWKYMRHSDVLVSTSDTESWCMAISEALALGCPVVATATDGAHEQITDERHGILCDFAPQAIARSLLALFKRRAAKASGGVGLGYDPIAEFSSLFDIPGKDACTRPKAVLVMDDANYHGGAHVAMVRMLKELRRQGVEVDVYSGVSPTMETRRMFMPIHVIRSCLDARTRIFHECGFRTIVFMKRFSLVEKCRKLRYSILRRISKKFREQMPDQVLCENVTKQLCRYETVICMSEGSRFRRVISNLPDSVRKVQLVHTFYALWKDFTWWTKEITSSDAILYGRMSAIALIGEKNVESFASLYPALRAKTFAFHNVIDIPLCSRAFRPCGEILRLVSVIRFEREKDVPRMIRVARRLKELGFRFVWDVYGDGSLIERAKRTCANSKVDDVFVIHGYENDAIARMREADLTVLLSHYEGLPNVVYESLCVGTPVFSTDVGGIPEQIEDGRFGRLVSDDENEIVRELGKVVCDVSCVNAWKRSLEGYRYDNERAVREFRKIMEPC